MTEAEVRRNLISVLQGQETLDAFEDWIVADGWDVRRDGSSIGTRNLVGDILLAFEDCESEADLRSRLSEFLETQTVVSFGDDRSVSSSATQSFSLVAQLA